MRLRDLTYSEALERHPVEVEAILGRLRRGRSKAKGLRPEELTWSYECAVRIGAFSFGDLLAGKAVQVQVAHTIDEKVAIQVERTMTGLHASHGRWSDAEKVSNPPEVAIQARCGLEEQARKKAEYDALPEAEKERQFREAFGQLSTQPGFVAISVPRKS